MRPPAAAAATRNRRDSPVAAALSHYRLTAQAGSSAPALTEAEIESRLGERTPAEWLAEMKLQLSGRKTLPEGSTGWFVAPGRSDDCLRPCISTVLQVPPELVPDPNLDARLAAGESAEEIDASAHDELCRFLDARGLRLVVHAQVPARRRRWIGVIARPGLWTSHCVVMSYAELVFDPVMSVDGLLGLEGQLRPWSPEDVTYGLSFQAYHATQSRTR
jgi:hypothetical protein